MHWLQLIASGLLSGGAGILLRLAATQSAPLEHGTGLLSNVHLLRAGALGLYGLGFLLYASALQKLSLAVAYPLMISVAMLSVVGFTLLAEGALEMTQVIGATLITAGIWLLTRSG